MKRKEEQMWNKLANRKIVPFNTRVNKKVTDLIAKGVDPKTNPKTAILRLFKNDYLHESSIPVTKYMHINIIWKDEPKNGWW